MFGFGPVTRPTITRLTERRRWRRLCRLLDKLDDTDLRRLALKGLGAIAAPKSVGAVARIATDENAVASLRLEAISALADIGGERATETLRVLLKDPQTDTSALEALVRAEGADAIPDLVAALEVGALQRRAAQWLVRLEWTPPPTPEGLRVGLPVLVLRGDWSACAAVGQPAVSSLFEALLQTGRHNRTEDATPITSALVEIGSPALEGALKLLDTAHRRERKLGAAILLGLYERGCLDEAEQRRVLACRAKLEAPHTDTIRHTDTTDDCGSIGQNQRSHTDTGGIDVSLGDA